MRANGIRVSAPPTARSVYAGVPRFSPKNFASTRATPTLANWDGCRLKPRSAIQREGGDQQGPVDVIVEAAFEQRFLLCRRRGFPRVWILVVQVEVRRRRRQRTSFLLREERVEDVMRDRRGVRSVNAVLEKHDAGDLGLVARREEEEPAVVAQVLVALS